MGSSSARIRGSAFVDDPWILYEQGVLTNPNQLLAGVIGKGKSMLAKVATRSIAFGRKVYVPGDPKGEWSVVARAVGGQAIELGGTLSARLNPLDEGPRVAETDDATWRVETERRRRALLGSLTESVLGRPLLPTEHTALDAALQSAVAQSATPILPMVVDALFAPSNGWIGSSRNQLITDGRDAGHALARLVHGDLAGLFDGPSTVRFNPDLPMISLDLSRILGSNKLMGLVMSCASAWMEAALADPRAGQRYVIYDEAWRLIAQPSLLARMQSQWKLSRALGIANLMVIHRLSDLDVVGDVNSAARNLALGLLADCSTRSFTWKKPAKPKRRALCSDCRLPRSPNFPIWIRERDSGASANALSWCVTSAQRAKLLSLIRTVGWRGWYRACWLLDRETVLSVDRTPRSETP